MSDLDRVRAEAKKAGSTIHVISTVHIPRPIGLGREGFNETFGMHSGDIYYITFANNIDDPEFTFHRPEDYPNLPKSVVEDANILHRASTIVKLRSATHTDSSHLNMLDNADSARKRMAIHYSKPWDHGGILLAGIGGWVCRHFTSPIRGYKS